MLQRRLTRLEKKLNVPPEERHNSAGQLQQAEETTVEGIRIYKKPSSMHLDNIGRAVNKTPLHHVDRVGESSFRWMMSPNPTTINTIALKGNDKVRISFVLYFLTFDHLSEGDGKVGLERTRRRRNNRRDTSSAVL